MGFLFSSLVTLLGWLISRLGTRGIRTLSRTLAWVFFSVFGIRKKVILDNLDIAFGQSKSREEKQRIAFESFASFLSTAFLFLASRWIFPKLTIEIVGEENIVNAVAKGRGVYGMVIHMSNFELHVSIGARYLKCYGVQKPIGPPWMNSFIRKTREAYGHFGIERRVKGDALGRIYQRLDEGALVGFMVDQRRKGGGLIVPLFGRDSYTNSGLFFMWSQRPAPIVPTMILQNDHDKFTMYFFPELKLEKREGQSDNEFIAEQTLVMNGIVEKMILMKPEQYFWMHKRWKM